jgi:hypothetical protein
MCRFDKQNPWGFVFHGASQTSWFKVPQLATGRPEKHAEAGIRLALLYRAQEFAVAVVRRRKNKREPGNPANSQ